MSKMSKMTSNPFRQLGEISSSNPTLYNEIFSLYNKLTGIKTYANTKNPLFPWKNSKFYRKISYINGNSLLFTGRTVYKLGQRLLATPYYHHYNDITIIDIDFTKNDDFSSHPFILEFGDDFISRFNTLTVKTPHGGFHLYFNYYPDLTSVKGYLQIDIINDDWYVLSPGSIIDGKQYHFCNVTSPKNIPPELVEWLQNNVYSGSSPDKSSSTSLSFISPQFSYLVDDSTLYSPSCYDSTNLSL